MRRRILVAILAVAVLAIALFAVPLAILVERFVEQDAMLRVERQAILAARVVPENFAAKSDTIELPTNALGIKLALYDPQGRRVAGDGPELADAVTLAAFANHVTDSDSGQMRVVAVPIAVDEQIIGVIRAEQSTAESDARTRRIVLLLGSIAITVLTVGAGVGYVIAGRLARPVLALRDSAVQLGDGDFTIDVPRSKIPEIDQAAVAMTAAAARLDDLITRERSFSADVSHQLRTPLAGLRAALETELEFPRPDPRVVLRESLDDVDRIERTISELLQIARTRPADNAITRLAKLLAEIESAWHGRFAVAGRPLTMSHAHQAPETRGNSILLRHALDVFLDNAITHGAGAVVVSHHAAADTVTISVSDEGDGFADDAASKNGLGLPLARRLVEALPGRLVIQRAGGHTRIDIIVQLADSSAD